MSLVSTGWLIMWLLSGFLLFWFVGDDDATTPIEGSIRRRSLIEILFSRYYSHKIQLHEEGVNYESFLFLVFAFCLYNHLHDLGY
jgi:hypothetical protein